MNYVTPAGFRDFSAEEAALREEITSNVQQLFAKCGYTPIETPTLEIMDVLQAGGHIPAAPFKLFDSQGELLAMRPDVTMQVARMCSTRYANCSHPLRFRYTQRVFRQADTRLQAVTREMTQIGVECIGEQGAAADAEVIGLMTQALQRAGVGEFKLALATVGVLRALLAKSQGSAAWQRRVLQAYHASNFVDLDALTSGEEVGAGVRAGAAGDADASARGEGEASGDACASDACASDAGGAGAGGKRVNVGAGVRADVAQAIRQLAHIRGGKEAIAAARALVEPLGCADGLDAFEQTYELLCERGLQDCIMIDFSVMSSFDYYTGVVFEAYAPQIGTPLGSGGRYDHMLAAYGQDRPAAGFAFYLEQVMAAREFQGAGVAASVQGAGGAGAAASAQNAGGEAAGAEKGEVFVPATSFTSAPAQGSAQEFAPAAPTQESAQAAAPAQAPALAPTTFAAAPTQKPLRIAVPKGSLNPDSIAALQRAGLDTTGLENPGRLLRIESPGVEYIIVRPTDAPTMVSLGAADCGICGKDSLIEANVEVVELVDLTFGACRFVVAEPAQAKGVAQARYQRLGSFRVATKYPRIARNFYAQRGMQVEIVKLQGNIELAPLTGIAERIIDITATGTTLRENNLVIVDEVCASTARFFANVCSFRTDSRVAALAHAMSETIGEATVIAGSSN